MELPATQLALLGAALWVWLWLVMTVRRNVPVMVFVQQNIGLSTPRLFYRLRTWRYGLLAGGVGAGAVAVVWGEARTVAAAGLFVVSAALLTLVHIRSAKLLHPRVVTSVFAQLHGDTWHDRFVDKLISRVYEQRPEGPPPATV